MRAVSLVDQVTDSLRQSIVDGAIAIGAKMPSSAAIAKEAGVSVSVVREALIRLRTLGLVDTRHGSGTVVVAKTDNGFRIGGDGTWNPALLAQLFDFRIDVESAAAMHAAQFANGADVATLRRALKEIARTIEEGTPGTDADLEFHLAIARLSKNVYRLQFIEYLNSEIHAAIDIARRSSARHPGLPYLVQKEHEAVVTAIERHDAPGASRAMRRHIASAAERLGLKTATRPHRSVSERSLSERSAA